MPSVVDKLRLAEHLEAFRGCGTQVLASWILKSPELGGAIGAFSDAVYNRSRLPMRTRELARPVSRVRRTA